MDNATLAANRRTRRAAGLDRTANDRYNARPDVRARKLAQAMARYRAPGSPQRVYRLAYAQRPEVKRRNAMREARRRLIIAGRTVVPFTLEQLDGRLSMWPGCWQCGKPATDVDHVKPLAAGGLHCLANLRPACRHCNRSRRHTWHGPAWAH